MVTREYDFLKLTSFSVINNWSVIVNTAGMFNSRYNVLPLKNVLVRSKDAIQIENDIKYKRITIKLYGMGVQLRDEIYGSEIGTKRQFIAHSGQLIISRIDARNGAFGIVPPELEGAIVTNDFWLFDVKDASIEFLMILLSSATFQPYWQSQSSGTTNRQRVNEYDFLDTQVPLPEKRIQEKIVVNYRGILAEAEENEKTALNFEKAIEQYFFDMLGIIEPNKPNDKKKFIKKCYLKDLSRWDVWNKKELYKSTKYQFIDFGSVIRGKPLYGANEKAIKTITDVRYIRITDINEDGSLNDDFVSAINVEQKYLLQENDFLIARSGNTVGKTFLYKSKMGKAIFAGYLIKFVLNEKRINPEYLLYYTKSKLFKSWIESNQRIFGQPNINGQEYLKAQIIVPPMEIQNKIAYYISEQKHKIKAHHQKSKDLLEFAKKQFEEVFFGEA